MKKNIFLTLLIAFSFSAQAKLFSNSYISFELPPNWSCKQEGFEHVCINKFSKQKKEAIIILTAKKRGPQDTLQNYESHLKKPRSMKSHKGTSYNSKIKSVRKRKVSGIDWIDGMHLGSEVDTYYTRYAATVKDSLGILVSFSAHKDHYSKYSSDFIKAIQSLKVIAPKELSQLNSSFKFRGKKGNVFKSSDSFPEGLIGEIQEEGDLEASLGPPSVLERIGAKGLIGILLLLITALGAFIYTKSR